MRIIHQTGIYELLRVRYGANGNKTIVYVNAFECGTFRSSSVTHHNPAQQQRHSEKDDPLGDAWSGRGGVLDGTHSHNKDIMLGLVLTRPARLPPEAAPEMETITRRNSVQRNNSTAVKRFMLYYL